MGDQDDDNPATMLLQQVTDPPGEPATERIPAMFAEQSAATGRPPSHGPQGYPPPSMSSVKTTPMPMPALGATMMLPETAARPGATLALPPSALQPPGAPREGNAGTLIIDSASVLAAAGMAPALPAPPAPPSAPPPTFEVQPIARAPYESISGRETPPPPLESLQSPENARVRAVQPAVPIGRAAPLPSSPPNVIVPLAEAPPEPKGSGRGGVLLVLLGALLVGGAAAALLVMGVIPSPWFAAKRPVPEASASAEATATAAEPATSDAPSAAPSNPSPPASETASASPEASVSAEASGAASATASMSASVSATASGPLPVPSIAVSVLAGDAYLLSYQGYLTVRSNTKADVAVQGVVSGKTNFKMMVRCGQRNVRLRKSDGSWLTEGAPILITCMQHTVTTIDL